MDAQSAAASVLGSLDSLLLLLGDPVQDRLFRYEMRQPGSIQRSLLRTKGRLTSKLAHQDNAHLKVMMLGPVADSLARRIGEIANPESGVLSVVNFRLNRVSESLRGSALAARGRVASQLNRAHTLMASRTELQSAHARLMARLSGDVMIDQQVRREITDVENQLANIDREESDLIGELQREADALRQRLDEMIQIFGGYVRLGFISRAPRSISDSDQAAEAVEPQPIEISDKDWLDVSRLVELLFDHADKVAMFSARVGAGFLFERLPESAKKTLMTRVSFAAWKRLLIEGGWANFGEILRPPINETLELDFYKNLKKPWFKWKWTLKDWVAVRGIKAFPIVAKKAFFWVGAVWDGVTGGLEEYKRQFEEEERSKEQAVAHGVVDGVLEGGVGLAAGALALVLLPAGAPVIAAVLVAGIASYGAVTVTKYLVDTDVFEDVLDGSAEAIRDGIKWVQGLIG